MNRYLPQWSLTRVKFSQIALEGLLSNIFLSKTQIKKIRATKKRFIAYSDLMIKCTRIVLFELLTDLHNGTIWTDKVLISKDAICK